MSEAWPADAASILRLEDDGSFTPVAFGLSAVVGVAVGPDGNTYASQLTTDFAAFAPGNVLRVNADGTTEAAVDGLVLAHGFAFDGTGDLHVAINSVNFGPGSPPGQVLRCTGVAGGGM